MIHELLEITILQEKVLKGVTHFGDPFWSPQCTIFLPQDIFHVKRAKLSENQKIGLITSGSNRGELYSFQIPPFTPYLNL